MNNPTQRALAIAACACLLALQTAPAFAQFTGAGSLATSWFVQLVTPLVPLACAAVGILCLTGRVNWPWFMAAICGTALFFGREQVVTMFRGWLGV
jgi:type IV secretory pathway VirB2 component (pilin)